MSVKKMKDGKRWYVSVRYKDWNGTVKQHKKEGFARQAEAKEYERKFLEQKNGSPDMTVESLYKLYRADFTPRLKATTCATKEYVLENFTVKYLGQMKLSELTAVSIRAWQSRLLQEELSPGYLRMISGQTSALFNFGVKYYGMKENPCHLVGPMGKRSSAPTRFWTPEEFNRFISVCSDQMGRVMFHLLFWTGMRVGELLALTRQDFDFAVPTVSITKTYHRINGEDLITSPKTEKSKRVIALPGFLSDMVKAYCDSIYDLNPSARLFPVQHTAVQDRMERYCKKSGVKKIRVHDLRHSHASFLIEHGFSPLLIAERLGHENIETTLGTYSHLYKDKQTQLVTKIEEVQNCYDSVTNGQN